MEQRNSKMELAKQKKAAFESTLELLMNQWQELDRHSKLRLGDSAVKTENHDSFDSKISELNDKRNELLMKVRELELTERISQKEYEEKEKVMEQRSHDLDSQQRALSEREMKLRSELEGVKRREAELHLGMKRLENLREGFKIKKMMFDLKMEGFSGASSSRSKPSKSAVKMKRRRDASDRARNVQTRVQGQDGLSFSLNIAKTHERSYMTVPVSFVSAYQDLSVKKYVILSTDKGDFRLGVRHYSTRILVQFFRGWKNFYTKNLLKVGCQCLFRLKENTVSGDASGFSMDVSVIDR